MIQEDGTTVDQEVFKQMCKKVAIEYLAKFGTKSPIEAREEGLLNDEAASIVIAGLTLISNDIISREDEV
jgi:hypothetical protein